MNKFEEEFKNKMNDLPLPPEDAAWENMRMKLDENRRRRWFFIPLSLRSCAGIAGAMIAMSIIAYSLFVDEPTASSTTLSTASNPSSASPSLKQTTIHSGEHSTANTNSSQVNNYRPSEQGGNTRHSVPSDIDQPSVNESRSSKNNSRFTVYNVQRVRPLAGRNNVSRSTGSNNSNVSSRETKSSSAPVQNNNTSSTNDSFVFPPANNFTINPAERAPQRPTDRLETGIDSTTITDGSETFTAPDSVSVAKPDSALQKKPSPKKIFFTAGLGIQQGIPVAGQSSVPYNYYGRSFSIGDYIPSLWASVHYEKWSLMGEFRYGAPQSVNDFSFNRNTTVDSMGTYTEQMSRLRKTYYHQMPISLNYEVFPSLTLGTGMSFNYFYGAVTENVTTVYDAGGVKSRTSNFRTMKGYTDSFLYKTHVAGIIQATYHYQRWSLSLRYSKDLQPYIRYTRPDGIIEDEKNQNVQAILRFRIFDSRR